MANKDKRIALRREHTGRVGRQWVVRFCDKWVGSSADRKGATALADQYMANR